MPLIGWFLGLLFAVRFFCVGDSIGVQRRGSDGAEEEEQAAAVGFGESVAWLLFGLWAIAVFGYLICGFVGFQGLDGGEVRKAGSFPG